MYKRDFSAPTLEDHFNKTILPKVMQVSCVVTALWVACCSLGDSKRMFIAEVFIFDLIIKF